MEDLILRRISQFPVTKVERVAPDAIRLVSEWFTTEVRIKDGKIVMEHSEIDLFRNPLLVGENPIPGADTLYRDWDLD